MKPLLLILPTTALTLALTGCADTPRAEKQVVAAATPESGTVCQQDQITGTRFTNTRCRTAADREKDKRNVEDLEEVTRRAAQSLTKSN